MKKKAKKIAVKLIEATLIEIFKELLRRLLRRKSSPEEIGHGDVPCGTFDRFESFFVKEFEQFFNRSYGHNIVNIINQVYSHLGKESPEITRRLKEIDKDYEWVDREFSDVNLALRDYEKHGDTEFFERTTRSFLKTIKRYIKFAKILNEVLLMHGKSETLKASLQTIEKAYNPAKEHFNRLIYDYYRFALRNKEYVSTTKQYETMLMYLPDIPSKENQLTLTKVAKEETIVEKL